MSESETDRPVDQFFWNGKCHKTCIKHKKISDLNKNSSKVIGLENIELKITNQETEQANDVTRVNVDYLELGDFIEHEIQELADNINSGKIVDTVYKTNLLVRLNMDIQDIKEVANLVVTEIEGGDDYS
ncbi:hypothetical protein F8M41_003252 [Gigaspora margarita]|uniref:Uncharacterized protein n=1 Tax=Gigaspora margarita TaxID=4874 RepID=A0A8H3XCX7_GIGMA|nr:hypothetical protein F8M41_003252 [Gigaspora margarita]